MKDLECACGNLESVDEKTVSVTCGDCVSRLVAPPEQPAPPVLLSAEEVAAKKERRAQRLQKQKETLDRMNSMRDENGSLPPRGWQLKKLFQHNGQWYARGKEITAEEAAELQKSPERVIDPTKKGKGWHLKKVFSHGGKWYSYGNEITEEEAQNLQTEQKVKAPANTGKGQGWHFKILFEHDGKFYSRGREITEEEYREIEKNLQNA